MIARGQAELVDNRDLSNGVVYIEQNDLVLSNNYVIVPITFTFEHLINNVFKIREGIDNTLGFVPSNNSDPFLNMLVNDLNVLKEEVIGEISKIYDFFYSLRPVNTRQKRGAINFIGEIASTLFGVATTEQLSALDTALSNFHELSEENANKLNILNKVVQLSTSEIDKLRKSQIATMRAVSGLLNTTKELANFENDLAKRQVVSHSFSKLALSLLELAESSDVLIDGVRTMFSGKIDERIISNKFFGSILNKVTQGGHKLLTSKTNELLVYKVITTVSSFFDTELKVIKYFLALPITNDIRLPTFKLNKIYSFPVPVKNAPGVYVEFVNLPNYIATSHEYFVELDSLSECKEVQSTHYCSLKSSLRSYGLSDTCASLMYKGNCLNCITKCAHLFSHDRPTRFLRIHDILFYFVNKTVNLEVLCENATANAHMALESFGYLYLGNECQALGDGILLPPALSFMGTSENLEFNTPITFESKLLNSSYFPQEIDGTILLNMTKSEGHGLDLNSILKIWEESTTHRMYTADIGFPYHYFSYILISVVVIATILFAIFLHSRLQKLRVEPVYNTPGNRGFPVTYRKRRFNPIHEDMCSRDTSMECVSEHQVQVHTPALPPRNASLPRGLVTNSTSW